MKKQQIKKEKESFQMIRRYKYLCKRCKEIKSIGYLHYYVYEPSLVYFICKSCEENKKFKIKNRWPRLNLLNSSESQTN